jgi:hypothetical protein
MTLYLQLNGTSDKLQAPSFTFDEVVLDMQVDSFSNFSKYFSYNFQYFQQTGSNTQQWSSDVSTVSKNGVGQTNLTNFLVVNERTTLDIKLIASRTYTSYIFNNMGSGSYSKGRIYSVKYLLSGVVKAFYDMSTGTVQDQSGNGNHGTLVGGTWVDDGTGGGGGTNLTLSLSDAITLGESFVKQRSGRLTLSDTMTIGDSETSNLTAIGTLTKLLNDAISITDSISIKSTRRLSLVDSITTGESFTKRRQSHLSLADGLTIGDTETSTKTTMNTLVRALSDSINMTDSITIRAMRYLTIFDLFSIVDSIGTTGGGNVAQTIKFKRGNEVDLPTLAEGEPAVTLDTNKMFVGTPNGNRQIATLLVVDSIANLPVADKSKQFLISGVLGGTGAADALYVCKKLSNDTYDWVQFV